MISNSPLALLVSPAAERHVPSTPRSWVLRSPCGYEVPFPSPTMDDGIAAYPKITRRHESPRAIFVERPRVATEPKDWFRGADLLRSNLLIVNPSEIRAFA